MQRYFLKNHQFQAKQVRITDEDASSYRPCHANGSR